MHLGRISETEYDPAVNVSVNVYDMQGDVSTVDLALTGYSKQNVTANLAPNEARTLAGWLSAAADACEKERAGA